MQKWEYLIAVLTGSGWSFKVLTATGSQLVADRVTSEMAPVMARLGEEGWELVAAVSKAMYFKRPKP